MICKCETLNITEKNDEQILVTVMRGFEQEASENESEGTPQPFPVEISTDIDVKLTTPRAQRLPIDFTVGDEGRILIDLKADRVKAETTYGLEVTGQVNGSRWCAIGDSVIRITRTTERGPKQVKVDADPYEVTLWAGYVGDVVPRHLRDLEGYAALTQLLDAMGDILGKKADTEDVTNALKNISDRFREYVPTSDKGKAGGVATLDSVGKILAAQLNMPWRGNFEGNFQASDTEPGIWGIDNRVIGPKPLNGEAAHGVMLVFPDRYKTTIFLVGPPNGAASGNAPEIYARRWMTGPKSWTNWLTTANFARKDDIPQPDDYSLTKDGDYLGLSKNGKRHGLGINVTQFYPPSMSQAEAEAGTATSARTMSAKTLKAAIEKHTENKATIDFVNSSTQTATAEFRGTHPSLEALQAVEADRNDYGYVEETDTDGNILVHRYKYVEGTGWQFEYDLNRTGFTAAEWQAIKSGITPEDVEKLRELPEKDTVMPLTRMTDELLNPDECLEPGVYENVQFPEVDYGLGLNDAEEPTKESSNATLLVSEVHIGGAWRAVQQVMIRTSGVHTLRLISGGPTYSESYYPPEGDGAEMVVRAIRFHNVLYNYPEIPGELGHVEIDKDGNIIEHPGTPGTPALQEWVERKYIGEWVPMATLDHVKKVVEAMRETCAKKSDIPDTTVTVGEEVLVGEWEENGVTYDLYRKVVSFGELPNAGQKTVAHGIANKVKFVRVAAMASNGFPIPFVTQDIDKAIYLALGNNLITINTHATDRSALTADVTIEFTRAKPSTT